MATDDFFRAGLGQMIDLRHALAVLVTRMQWSQMEANWSNSLLEAMLPQHARSCQLPSS